ncbi:MAG: SufD family Fe-S cluster assembly protein [Candidatus Nanohaloarchaea archaeon]
MTDNLVFEDESQEFSGKRQESLELVEELDAPESIRTPGRTWTRYPDFEDIETREVKPEIKTEGEAEVYTGQEAVEEAGEKLFDAVKREENRLTALHAAKLNSLVYVEADGDAKIEISYDEEKPVFSHLVVETGESAEVAVTETFRGNPELLTSIGEFYVGKNSSLTYGGIQSIDGGFNYSARKAIVRRDGEMNWLNSVFGSEKARNRLETVLKGDNSSTGKIGAWYGTGEQHHDLSFKVRHIGENTTCDMKSRAVIDDSARSVYEGLQSVEESAPDTSSFQRENALILSDRAEVDASPKLMIENNDVEASHAATAGQLPDEELHYMKSRGLTEEDARRLIVKGFFEPIMGEIKLPELKERVREEVLAKLEG